MEFKGKGKGDEKHIHVDMPLSNPVWFLLETLWLQRSIYRTNLLKGSTLDAVVSVCFIAVLGQTKILTCGI